MTKAEQVLNQVGDKLTRGTLFAGPYFGEFGHEVLGTGLLRAHARHFDRVIVCSRAACEPLYEDIATEFRPHNIECVPMADRATGATMPSEETLQGYIEPDCERFPMPNCGSAPTEEQIIRLGHYRRLGTPCDEWRGVAVFHARNRQHEPGRNWPQENWNALADWVLRNGLARQVVCVGTRESAMLAEGCCDMRSSDLTTQMDIGASAAFAVGPSSGWMHLASLCGCPHLTWVGGKEYTYVRRRYMDRWNPLRTPAHVIEKRTWQPSVLDVCESLVAFLKVAT